MPVKESEKLTHGWLIEVEDQEREESFHDDAAGDEARVQRYRVAIPGRAEAVQEVARLVGVTGDSVRVRVLAELSAKELGALLAAGLRVAKV
jgi:hypothetical protein